MSGGEGSGRRLLGQVLKDLGVLREGQVQEALAEQRSQGGLLGEILVQLGHCTRADVTRALAEQAGLRSVDLAGAQPGNVDTDALAAVNGPVVRRIADVIAMGARTVDMIVSRQISFCQRFSKNAFCGG